MPRKSLDELTDAERHELGRTLGESVNRLLPGGRTEGGRCRYVLLLIPEPGGRVLYVSNVHPDEGAGLCEEASRGLAAGDHDPVS